jgi:hypothetical protein
MMSMAMARFSVNAAFPPRGLVILRTLAGSASSIQLHISHTFDL